MKLSKKILLSTLGLGAIAVTVPVVLTSCSEKEENASQGIDFIDLSKYKTFEANGVSAYSFMSTSANDDLKGKSVDDIKTYLGVSNEIGGTISKDGFDKMIKNLTFTNTGGTESLSYSDIKTEALNNENVSNMVTIMSVSGTTTVGVTFTLKNNATWSNGSKDSIMVQYMDMSSVNPGA